MESKIAVGKINGERSFPQDVLAVSDKFLSHWTSCQEDNLGRKRKMRRGKVTNFEGGKRERNKRHRVTREETRWVNKIAMLSD